VSFLLYSEHGFQQAPYEEIDEAKYKKMVASVKSLVGIQVDKGEGFSDLECVGGVCPIK